MSGVVGRRSGARGRALPGAARLFRIGAVLLLALAPRPGAAQPGEGVTVAGRVTGPDGAPVPEAAVEAKDLASGVSRATRTDAAGRYSITLPGAGPEVVLSVERLGFVGATVVVPHAAAERSLARDVRLAAVPVALAPVEGRSQRRRTATPVFRREDAGETSQGNPAVVLDALPVTPGDLGAIAALAPGAVALPGRDASVPGVSIAGQDPGQNRTSVDGARYGAAAMPAEAVARADVITSTYDPSRGRFTGGEIAVSTRGGTDVWGGALRFSLRAPALQYGAAPGAAGGGRHTLLQAGGGGGGVLFPDRLYVYGAAEAVRRTSPAPFLDPADRAGLASLSLSPDSVQRFYSILRGLGIPGSAPGAGEQRTEVGSAIVRFDLLLGEAHSLMVRADAQGSRITGAAASELAVPAGGRAWSATGGLLGELASRVGAGRNTFRAYANQARRGSDDTGATPAAVVDVGSRGDDGTVQTVPLLFGASPVRLPALHGSMLELSDELSLPLRGEVHRLKLGGVWAAERMTLEGAPNESGTFVFRDLGELEAGRPSSFSRTLPGEPQRGDARYAALFAGDSWRLSPRLALTYGVRWERNAFPARTAGDPAAGPFGLAPGRIPSSAGISPRAGFTYRTASGKLSLHGGAGQFRGTLPLPSLAAAASETGGAGADLYLSCTGGAAPAPEWTRYLQDPGAIPTTCAGGAPVFASRAPRLTLFAPGFAPPRVWRASLGASWQVRGRYFLSADATRAQGFGQPLAVDRNLEPVADFALAGEGGRPVYVPVEALDTLTGTAAAGASRLFPAYGRVRELGARGRSATDQLGLGVTGLTPWTGSFAVRYTFTHSRDQVAGMAGIGGSAASTAGDPREVRWGRSDIERPHALQLLLTHRVSRALELSAVGNFASGVPFTPMVDGDVNGDGLYNDRAFVFPAGAAGDTALAAGLSRLSASARACLERQAGRVAGRNSCRSPATASLDFQANIRPGRLGMSRRLLLTVTAYNALAGVDYLLHGSSGLRGWGQYPWVDNTLLRVKGFDPGARAFRYEVNPDFGRPLAARGGLRVPFALTLQGRVTVGADPAWQQLAGAVQALRGRARPVEEVRAELLQRVVNLPGRVLDENARRGLRLTPEQAARLRAAADSLQPRIDAVVDTLARRLAAGSAASAAADIRPLTAQARALVEEGVREVRETLTSAQWNRLPAELREPRPELDNPAQRVRVPAG